MGFFSKKNADNTPIVCALCDKPLGLNRYSIGKADTGKRLWKCPSCAQKGGFIKIIGEKAFFCDSSGNLLYTPAHNEEFRMKCNTCGHVYCFTQADLDRSKSNAKSAAVSSTIGVLNAVAGTQLGACANMAQARHSMNKIIDYSKCPKCNSHSITKLSAEDWEREKASANATPSPHTTDSALDELKKLKELLDEDIITQEEFDAKKKQLLGL